MVKLQEAPNVLLLRFAKTDSVFTGFCKCVFTSFASTDSLTYIAKIRLCALYNQLCLCELYSQRSLRKYDYPIKTFLSAILQKFTLEWICITSIAKDKSIFFFRQLSAIAHLLIYSTSLVCMRRSINVTPTLLCHDNSEVILTNLTESASNLATVLLLRTSLLVGLRTECNSRVFCFE